MDQKKAGTFIAMLRREKGYTQRELADRLELSEKTISKWECGNGLPEVVYIEPLCSVSISVAVMSAGLVSSRERFCSLKTSEKFFPSILTFGPL